MPQINSDCLYSKKNTLALSTEGRGANGAERKTENLRAAGKEQRPTGADRGQHACAHGAWDTQSPCLPSNAPTRTCGQPHPITIPSRAEQHPHTSGFRLLTKRTEFPAPARPGMAMRPAAAAAAAEGMARGASAPWTLGTERPARESSVDLSLDGCAKRRQAPSSHTQPQGVTWLWTAQEATHTA